MSIMELDPPDYWLVHDEETSHMPMRRVWIVAPLRGPKGEQVVLARVDPPATLATAEHDFALIVPRIAAQHLIPMSHYPMFAEIGEYYAAYRDQTRLIGIDYTYQQWHRWTVDCFFDWGAKTICTEAIGWVGAQIDERNAGQ